MRAAVLHAFGGPEHFSIDEVSDPVCGPHQVVIQAKAAAINPVDWKIREGYQRVVVRRRPPMILGMDVSGVIIEVGAKVKQWSVGDEVYASPNHKGEGTYAQKVALDAQEIARKPTNLTHQEAASIPLVGLTTWQALVETAKLKAGEAIFIEAGAGGIGSFALQLAKHLGAQVATTCSPHNEERVRALGADQVINYREHNFDEVLEPQDVIYEMMGFESRERALRVLKPGGRLVSINGGLVPLAKKHGPLGGTVRAVCNLTKFSIRARLRHSIQVSNVIRKPNGDHLAKLTALLEEGALKACVDRVYPLDEIAQAHQYSQSGHAQGKIVIDLA